MKRPSKNFRKTISLEADDASVWNDFGWALQRQDKFDESISALQQSVKLDPESTKALGNLAMVNARAGLFDRSGIWSARHEIVKVGSTGVIDDTYLEKRVEGFLKELKIELPAEKWQAKIPQWIARGEERSKRGAGIPAKGSRPERADELLAIEAKETWPA